MTSILLPKVYAVKHQSFVRPERISFGPRGSPCTKLASPADSQGNVHLLNLFLLGCCWHGFMPTLPCGGLAAFKAGLALNIQIAHVMGVFLNKIITRFDLVPHQDAEHVLRLQLVGQIHL